MDTVEELRAFFSACDCREEGREPDWQDHLAVIEASKSLAREIAEGYEAEARNSSLDPEWAEVETEGLLA